MSSYSIRSLEVFSAVADAGSFAAAADRLQISQPSVSEHIQKLERRLGQPLFLRQRGVRAELTVAGQALLIDARTLLQGAANLDLQAATSRRQTARRLVISCHRPLAQAVLAPRLASFVASRLDSELSLHTGTVEDVAQRLRTGAADLGFFLARNPPADLDAAPLGREEFVIVAGRDVPLTRMPSVSCAALSQYPFLRASHQSGYAKDVTRMLDDAGIVHGPPAARTSELSTLIQLAEAGIGLLCASRRAVQAQLDAGRLVELALQTPPLSMEVWVARADKRSPRPIVDAFAAHMREAFGPAATARTV